MSDAPRNLELERQRTMEPAALLFELRPITLCRLAELRAGSGPVVDIETREFDREVLEELADARNYIVWRLQQIDLAITAANGSGRGFEEIRASWVQAMAGVAFAWEHAARAERLALEQGKGASS